jgi:predicted dehydrogenase
VPFTSAPTPCGSYQELLDRKDIDAVYIPLPTGIRKEWVIRAAEAGKHVICEKPCGVTSADVRAMIDVCRRHNVQFMDGVMFMHSRRLDLLRQTLDDQHSVGTMVRIASQFSFRASDEFLAGNIRVQNDLEPLGCLGDLGWYNIRLSLWLMKEQLPARVSGRTLQRHGTGSAGVPLAFSGELFFASGVSASFYCSFVTHHQQWANVSGTHGYLHIDDFVVPFFGCEAAFTANAPFLRITGCDFNMESHFRGLAVPEYSNAAESAQETRMIDTFSRLVKSGRLDPHWPDQALKTQQVLDACLQSAREDGKIVPVA